MLNNYQLFEKMFPFYRLDVDIYIHLIYTTSLECKDETIFTGVNEPEKNEIEFKDIANTFSIYRFWRDL